MQVTGTLINYYFFCHRQLWLHANDIRMENTSELVEMRNLIHETSYLHRSEKYKEVEIGSIKIDFYDAKEKIIHEVKKSSKFHETHIWQLKYYIYILEHAGIEGVSGILEYPKERKTEEIFLSKPDRVRLTEIENEIFSLIHSETCPPLLNNQRCKNCSYFDFCYSNESEES